MKRYLETIKREDAIRRVLDHVKPIEEEEYLPAHAQGTRHHTASLSATFQSSLFLCSAMDGYATSFVKTLEADFTTLFLPLAPMHSH